MTLGAFSSRASDVSVAIKHDPKEREFVREDALQRETVHS
jgi:hypothetical protein